MGAIFVGLGSGPVEVVSTYGMSAALCPRLLEVLKGERGVGTGERLCLEGRFSDQCLSQLK